MLFGGLVRWCRSWVFVGFLFSGEGMFGLFGGGDGNHFTLLTSGKGAGALDFLV